MIVRILSSIRAIISCHYPTHCCQLSRFTVLSALSSLPLISSSYVSMDGPFATASPLAATGLMSGGAALALDLCRTLTVHMNSVMYTTPDCLLLRHAAHSYTVSQTPRRRTVNERCMATGHWPSGCISSVADGEYWAARAPESKSKASKESERAARRWSGCRSAGELVLCCAVRSCPSSRTQPPPWDRRLTWSGQRGGGPTTSLLISCRAHPKSIQEVLPDCSVVVRLCSLIPSSPANRPPISVVLFLLYKTALGALATSCALLATALSSVHPSA